MAKLLTTAIVLVSCSETLVAQRTRQTTTTTEIPTPFEYEFAAGRRPGGKPDRYVNSKGDEHGTITGSYTYLDPNYKWQRVNYKASEENGFEILPGSTLLANQPDVASNPRDSVAVQKAKAQHEALYQEIYASHQANPVPYPDRVLQETKAVQKKRNEFANEFQRIAAEHARIEAEHAAIAAEQAKLDPDYVDYTQTK